MSNTQIEDQSEPRPSLPREPFTLQTIYEELSQLENPDKISDLVSLILSYLYQTQGSTFEEGLQFVLKIMSKRYTNLLTQSPQLTKQIMTHFVSLSKTLRTESSVDLQYRRLFTLSILAEFVRQEPKLELSYSSDFLRELFELEVEGVAYEARVKLLAIVGVLYSNLSRQPSLLRELKAAKRLKETILENYTLIEEPYTFKLFNQSIVQLQTKRLVSFTLCELDRYGIKKALAKTLGEGRSEVVQKYLQRIFGKRQS